ncbi:TetR/AcrR family transcriptional regulator [Nocardia sp. alder85J]|uniref:TetR/AcrR family transcriptional regulator n=1 Tax=Nocardia sp. alder85J TaxID=2862949 RepID=UPI001CD7167D|nr:TetR/AcrR family transcriptional regulator [Nocardia sp. alder85J]MCX4091288.1 TetR family transcriptional regulator [Nocardia sp. alder85J]
MTHADAQAGGDRRGRRKERSAETEQALKDAARAVFAERGYLNTKITDITAAAGRAAGSFYNHFASKEDLLRALLDDLAAEGDLDAARPEHKADFTDPDAIRYHVEAYWRFSRRNWPVLRAMSQAALVNDEFAAIMRQFAVGQRDDILDHMAYVPAAGLRLPTSPEAGLTMMFAAVEGLLQAAREGTLEITDEQAVEDLTRFLYRGLTGRDY